ncbi:hypothetical protein [uncultured Sphaerochaeta sp.]|uniref:hypothetical protein n=1 Tax=uncultured Sphaerochaeta sp. TaxID=886478 RepID=UPI002A0A200A|nr:hypothetical protein [uncultured Sphaerochaeta sp.]
MNKTLLRKSIAMFILVALVSLSVFAENTSSGNVKFITAGPTLEAKLEAGYTLKMDMLQGDGALFSGNNLKLKGVVGISPVAATASLSAVLTPIAVIELNVGASVGTGWNCSLLGMDLVGLYLGTGPVGSVLSTDQLGGMYYEGKVGAAFQFDTAAVIPGDWTSIILRTYQEVNYQGYTNAGDNIAWEYETNGAMVNGFNYTGEYVLGYQMPLKLNLVALMLDTYSFDLFSGNDHPFFYQLGLAMNYAFTDSLNLTVIPQITNMKKDDNKQINEVALRFKRVALMLNYSF